MLAGGDVGDAQESLTFRSNIRPWLYISALVAVSGPILYTVILFTSPHNTGKPFSLGTFLTVLLWTSICGAGIAALTLFSQRRHVVKVFASGLQCFDRTGRNHFIEWKDILSVQPVQHDYGLHYLYIRVPFESSSITMPLFLEDMPRFINTVEGYAGRDNALVKELRGT